MGTLVFSGCSDKGARFICQMLAARSVRQMGWALVGQRKENTGRCRKIMIHVDCYEQARQTDRQLATTDKANDKQTTGK